MYTQDYISTQTHTHLQFCEHLVLTYNDTSHLRLKLSGTGVQPDVRLTPDTNTYDLGHAMVRDTVSGVLQLTNHSPLAVRYQLSLESSLPGAAERRKKEGRPFSELFELLLKLPLFNNFWLNERRYVHDCVLCFDFHNEYSLLI